MKFIEILPMDQKGPESYWPEYLLRLTCSSSNRSGSYSSNISFDRWGNEFPADINLNGAIRMLGGTQ